MNWTIKWEGEACSFKLSADGLVGFSSLLQLYGVVPEVLWQLFGLAYAGAEAGIEETDSVDRCTVQT